MVRKLVKPLLTLILLAPAGAYALGLGDVKLHSALNQNLNADIELLSVEPGDTKDLSVSLASSETFAKLGLSRPSVLMFVQFEVKQKPDGTYYINATSKQAIREPFLDFLIEVKWPAGRVLREYTLLLDPPTRHAEMGGQVSAATAGAAQPAATVTGGGAPSAAQPAVSAPMQTQQGVAYYPTQATTTPAGGVSYGPIKGGDTLWKIALKVRPNTDISAQQMMMALLKANPHAFVDNNINRLKKGFVLRVDDPALYAAMSQAEAAREVSRQTRAWEDYRAEVAAKAGERQPVAAEGAPAGSAAVAGGKPKLKLVAPEGKGKQAGTSAAAGDMEEQLMLALESSAAQRKENEELQSRVGDLEAQLQDMQRLLALKDSDMATLQKQLREQGTAVTLPSEKAAKTPEKAAEAAKVEKPVAGKPAAKAAKPAEATAAAKPATKQPAKPVAKPKPKPRVIPPPREEPGFIDMLLGDQMMMIAAGGVLALLLLLVLFISRRRKKGGFQESILSGGTSSMLNSGVEENRGETSFLSDLAISGMGGGSISTDEGEVDPLTEADVFMAYGRYQQAEEVLKKALESNPDRPDVTGKLFEVYFNTREKDKFEQLANESAASLQDNEAIWASVAAMGKEICPDNPLFAAVDTSAVESVESAAKPEPITDDVLDIGLDLDELSAEMEGEADTSGGIDLGLDLSDLESEPAAEPEPVAEAPAEAAPAEESVSDLDFDLDFGDEGAAEPEPAPAVEAESSGLGDLDFDLGDLGGEEESQPVAAAAEEEVVEPVAEEATTLDLGDMDLGDIDFGDLGAEAETPAAEETSLDLSEVEGIGAGDELGAFGDLEGGDMFGEGDEITTKLDLAQAYIEMGDGEGARSMLDEVVVQGNAQQKQQAEALLSRI